MAKKEDAVKHWQDIKNRLQERRPVRFALTGDGRGNATSNLIVPANDNYYYARELSDNTRYFPVLNRGKVGPYINLPVVIGYDDIEPEREQILGINYDALPDGFSASRIYTIGIHAYQHMFGGGDEVYIDSRLFLPGLVSPTNPPSMQVDIKPFVYFYNDWNRYT